MKNLKEQRQRRLQGKHNCIPFYEHFPRLSKFIPGLFKECLATILSNSGVGKTKLAKYLNVIIPYELHKKYGVKFRTIYFALEESKEEFVDSMIIMMLQIHHGIVVDRLTLNSYYENPLSEDMFRKVELVKEYVEDIMSFVDVVDDIHFPTGIFKYCEDIANKKGKHHKKTVSFKNGQQHEIYDYYEPHDEEEYVIVVVDHISLLAPEKGAMSLREAMSRWSTDYAMKIITKRWKWIVINVQQAAMSSEDINHFKANKLELNMSAFGK